MQAIYEQGANWEKSNGIACQMSEEMQVALVGCVGRRVIRGVGVPPKKVKGYT